MRFHSYFDDVELGIEEDTISMGCLYEYVSGSVLEKYIKTVTPIRAWVVNRYLAATDIFQYNIQVNFSGEELSIQDILETKTPTKAQVISLLNQPYCSIEPKYDRDFQDDLVILAKFDNSEQTTEESIYCYFWFDRDCSDCCIGQFSSSDAEDDIISSFDAMVHESNQMGKPDHVEYNDQPFLIKLSYFSGH